MFCTNSAPILLVYDLYVLHGKFVGVLENVTIAGTLISSVKVSVAPTSAEVIDLAESVD